MRAISTDDIETVEVVRGIPSVEYGDLTSGLVKIERRQGGHDLGFRLKSDMGSKLFYVAKGLEWKEQRLTLNLSADYLNAKADPRNRLENYKRVTLSARLHKTWEQEAYSLGLSANLDYTGSFDDDKVDPT
jgi:outer membrane cobalamin receptor